MEHITIVYATTDDYQCVLVSLTSLILTAKENTFYDVYFLIDESFTDHSKRELEEICQSYEAICKINFCYVENIFDGIPLQTDFITKQTFYRLLIPDIVKADRCIYLDRDTIVCTDLLELFHIQMERNLIAGVKAPLWHKGENKEYCEQCLLPSLNQYINAGVLLMNLSEMRKNNMVEKFLELIPYNMAAQDQDIVNSACYGRIQFLPFEYNVMTKYADWRTSDYEGIFTEEEVERARNNPKIIHYADRIKPWNDFDCPLGDYWWSVCKKSHAWRYFYHKREDEFFARTVYHSRKANSVFTTKQVFKEFNPLAKKKLVIYGAGNRAEKLIAQMLEQGVKPEYILVSDKRKNPAKIDEIAVRELSDIERIGRDKTVIIATLERYHAEIIASLQSYDCGEIVPLSDKWTGETYLIASELKKITDQYQKIIIYGAGNIAKKTYDEMLLNGLKPDYFVVTKRIGNTFAYVDDVPVYEIKDCIDDLRENHAIILVAVSDLYQEEVGGVLRFYNLHNYLPISVFNSGWLYDTAYGRLLRELHQSPNIQPTNEITLLNTQLGSDNLGDDIIMYYTRRALEPLLKGNQVYEVATHLKPSDQDIEHMLSSKAVIACGTNFLKSGLEASNWVFDIRMIHMKNFILFAAGSGNFGEGGYSLYTRVIWNMLLHNDWLHSVRESDTQNELLRRWNVANVINTGCVTLFGGKVDEICCDIPTGKANKVVLTVTGHRKDAELDLTLFSICERLYDEIYFWPQGDGDLDWMSSIYDLTKVKIVEHTLEAYNKILAMDDLDYIGSRLHGGIHAMAHGKRSLIIAIDNRAAAFHKDTNIPIIYRNQVKDFLCDRVLSKWKTEIHLDHERIDQWFAYTRKKLNE